MTHTDKSIAFASNLLPLIANGTKTLTYRLGNKYNFLEMNDLVDISNASDGAAFAQVEILEKSWTTFKELPIDKKGHEIYSSKQDQRDTFKQYYGKELENDDKILVLGFKVVKLY